MFISLKNDNVNDFYELPKGGLLYRGDDNKISVENYKPRFFVYNINDTDSYGKIKYQFKVNNTLRLLALDKDVDNFYNNSPSNIQNILLNNYGYVKGIPLRKRNSVSDSDNTLLTYICSLGKYDGYATDIMESVHEIEGQFHSEVCICDSTNYEEPTILSNLSTEDKERAHEDAQLIRLSKLDKETRKNKSRSIFDSESSVGKLSFGFDDDDDDDEHHNDMFSGGGNLRKTRKSNPTKKPTKKQTKKTTKKSIKKTTKKSIKKTTKKSIKKSIKKTTKKSIKKTTKSK